ncbi:hypothetical protein G3480_19045 [Thiorhodococcus mannitoliphagus]|uniref:Uncharacterized protein n=1 Tax=Thiorhodococcus mannitoliphagus TaxID=329406 RepID=A0A6P1DVK7_9GAMM|nr:hypothetical protein [Thiorhodococcus mannitoliphagus]NEX22377.1 hypothetical protein [Thiorhodococcus mannitoliphagus]
MRDGQQTAVLGVIFVDKKPSLAPIATLGHVVMQVLHDDARGSDHSLLLQTKY